MKITILGPAHPYRGGLASIMQTMAYEFQRNGNEVDIKTFSLQYPKLLFPGESQTLDSEAPKGLTIERCVNTINPINWIRIGLRLKKERPDFILYKYWTPFMAPCFGTIARIARSNGHTKVICQIDNVEPHEHHIIDRPCNHYFLGCVDGFVYMSEQVHSELKPYTSSPAIFSPHPMFENFGKRVNREEACRALGVDPQYQYAMFFGLIRSYKGLDMLIKAWGELKRRDENRGKKLLIAGEFYSSKEPYMRLIEECDIADDVILHGKFIADEDVKNYFSVADFVVLPYHTASQSGVTQIAYNFSLPMIVTNVGGLPEIVPNDRAGYVCEPTPEGVAEAVSKIWSSDTLSRLNESIIHERKRFSWEEMCRKIIEVYNASSSIFLNLLLILIFCIF
ncbi:MAG: glycosyltransferase [Rikenellaceae bacterium]